MHLLPGLQAEAECAKTTGDDARAGGARGWHATLQCTADAGAGAALFSAPGAGAGRSCSNGGDVPGRREAGRLRGGDHGRAATHGAGPGGRAARRRVHGAAAGHGGGDGGADGDSGADGVGQRGAGAMQGR